MAKIKWRKSDELKLSRYVRKFNASLTRMAKMEPDLADAGILPKRVTVNELRDRINTRRDFNREIADIDRWFRKTTQSNRKQSPRDIVTDASGIKMTRWQYERLKRRADIVARRRKKVREQLNISDRESEAYGLQDVSVDSKLAEIRQRLNNSSKNNFTDFENEMQSWENFEKSVLYQSSDSYYSNKNAIYYDNYHIAVYENFSDEQARDISYRISDLGLDGYQLFVLAAHDDRLEISWMYSKEEVDQKYGLIMELLPKLAEEVFGIVLPEDI